MTDIEKLAMEIYLLSNAPIEWEKLSDDILIKKSFRDIARFVAKEILKARLDELEMAKGKMALQGYHSGAVIDIDWILHRIDICQQQLKKLGG